MPRFDFKCPSCETERTQRLSLLRRFYGDGGFVGLEFASKGLERPHQPWGFTLGFFLGLLLGSFAYEFLPERFMLVSVAVLILVWVSVGGWAWMSYKDKRVAWERELEQYFLCLRCGEVFRPQSPRHGLL